MEWTLLEPGINASKCDYLPTLIALRHLKYHQQCNGVNSGVTTECSYEEVADR